MLFHLAADVAILNLVFSFFSTAPVNVFEQFAIDAVAFCGGVRMCKSYPRNRTWAGSSFPYLILTCDVRVVVECAID